MQQSSRKILPVDSNVVDSVDRSFIKKTELIFCSPLVQNHPKMYSFILKIVYVNFILLNVSGQKPSDLICMRVDRGDCNLGPTAAKSTWNCVLKDASSCSCFCSGSCNPGITVRPPDPTKDCHSCQCLTVSTPQTKCDCGPSCG